VRVFACLSWFDESPRWLAATVASCARFCDHVIAVDGAYLLYPGGRASSGGEQAETIHATATAYGMGCTVHTPATVWGGNEVAKRNAYVGIADVLGTLYEDWLFVIDADEVVSDVSPLWRADLEAAEEDVAEVGYWSTDELRNWVGPSRRLYRLLPQLRYGPTHFTVRGWSQHREVFLNGRGSEYSESMVDALNLTSQIRVEHKHSLRDAVRNEAAVQYGLIRDEHDIEAWR
jgi:hypothetical protein